LQIVEARPETGAVAGSSRCDNDDMGRFEHALATLLRADRSDTPQVSRWTPQLALSALVTLAIAGGLLVLP
jgi:hypothetical protein